MNYQVRELIRRLLLRREDELGTLDGLKEGSPRWIESKVNLLSGEEFIENIIRFSKKERK